MKIVIDDSGYEVYVEDHPTGFKVWSNREDTEEDKRKTIREALQMLAKFI